MQTGVVEKKLEIDKRMNLQTRHVEIDAQGGYFAVRQYNPYILDSKPRKKAVRGIVDGFSRKSRKRLLDLFARIDTNVIAQSAHRPKFITLTYPSQMEDHERASRDLKAFVQRITRRQGDVCVVWRKEIQERGAIHFHLIAFGLGFWHVQNMQAAWGEVIGEDAKNSLDLQVISSRRGVMRYCSKYVAKQAPRRIRKVARRARHIHSQAVREKIFLGLSMRHKRPHTKASTGRWWGVWGRANLPLGEQHRINWVVTRAHLRMFADIIRAEFPMVAKYVSHDGSFSIYSDLAHKIKQIWYHVMQYLGEWSSRCENIRQARVSEYRVKMRAEFRHMMATYPARRERKERVQCAVDMAFVASTPPVEFSMC